jgi:uncharacterized protein
MQPEWLYGLWGGLLIGTASAIYLLAIGRIAGISGILGNLVNLTSPQDLTRSILFLGGILVGAIATQAVTGAPGIEVHRSITLLIVGGLLVGFGTRLGSGCTSGHGVCGMSRLSKRSLIATAIFMATAIIVQANRVWMDVVLWQID